MRKKFGSDPRIDFYFLALIAFLSMGMGSSYITVNGSYARFYQNQYGPAVMVALGKGYHNPVTSDIPELKKFLQSETRELNIDALPQNIATKELTALQTRWRYLLTTVGFLWKVFGINWDSLIILYLTFFTASNCFTYLIARNFLPRTWALFIGLLLVFSPLNLHFLPQLRDYSKAPFILFYIFLVFRLFQKERSPVETYGYFSLLGIVGGVGLGFRADMIILVPLSLLIAVTMVRSSHPGTRLWKTMGYKVSVCIVFILAFVVASFPILSGRSSTGSNSFHVLILGHAEVYDEVAGIGGVNYSFDTHYKDAYVYTLAVSYAQRVGLFPEGHVIQYQSKDYDIATGTYYKSLVALIPADFYLRTYRTFENILNYLPFTTPVTENLFKNELLKTLFETRWNLLGFLSGFGLLFFITNLLIFAYRDFRKAWLYAIVFLYFLSYPSLQLRERHFFHLESLYWLNVALFFYLGGGLLTRMIFKLNWKFIISKENTLRFFKTMVVLAIAIVLFFTGLISLRFVQEKNLKNYFNKIQAADYESIPFEMEANEGKCQVHFSPNTTDLSLLKGPTDFVTNFIRLRLFVSGNGNASMAIQYQGDRATDLTSVYSFQQNESMADEIIEFYFPVYETAATFRMRGKRSFDGVTISANDGCEVLSIERLADISSLSFLPVLLLSSSHREPMSYYSRSVPGMLPRYPKIRWRRSNNMLTQSPSNGKLNVERKNNAHINLLQSKEVDRKILDVSDKLVFQKGKKYELYLDALVSGDKPVYLQLRREGIESVVELSFLLKGKSGRVIRSFEFLPKIIDNCEYRLVAVFPQGEGDTQIRWNHLYLTQINIETIR